MSVARGLRRGALSAAVFAFGEKNRHVPAVASAVILRRRTSQHPWEDAEGAEDGSLLMLLLLQLLFPGDSKGVVRTFVASAFAIHAFLLFKNLFRHRRVVLPGLEFIFRRPAPIFAFPAIRSSA